MELQTELLIRGENIQRVYDWYINRLFLVNRKYQRKLVWSIEEKESFIDSIRNHFSVPLFLVAKKTHNNIEKYEIIDGMQRLNSIFAFIEGEFSLKTETEQGFFDLSTMARTKELLDDGKIKQKTPILSRSLCADIVSYQLPLSVASFSDESKVEEIFRRINSYGRQLSQQELRQAGALGKFPDLVRVIASDIRRDSSPTDLVDLDRMKEISLSNRKLPYGIALDSIFWVKQNVIIERNMRISRDEELIAYILVHILLSDTVNPSSKTLDTLYRFDLDDTSNIAGKAESQIEKLGFDNIKKWFQRAFDEFEIIAAKANKDFRSLLFGNDGQGLVRSFQVIFLAFYELIINQQKQIKDYNQIIKLLDGIGARHLKDIDSDKWNGAFRNEKIKSVCSIIDSCFEKSSSADPATDNWVSKFENLLMQSRIEQQQFDFKIGLHRLTANAEFNDGCFHKIIKTLTAMANNSPNKKGYVIVGIADNEADKLVYENLYSKKAIEFNNFNITGVQSESLKKYHNRDEYYNKIKQMIMQEPIEDYTKSFITRNMRLLQYFEKDVLIFEIESIDKPLFYDKKLYERQGANVELIDPLKYSDVFKRF
jgi:hypothetical protein